MQTIHRRRLCLSVALGHDNPRRTQGWVITWRLNEPRLFLRYLSNPKCGCMSRTMISIPPWSGKWSRLNCSHHDHSRAYKWTLPAWSEGGKNDKARRIEPVQNSNEDGLNSIWTPIWARISISWDLDWSRSPEFSQAHLFDQVEIEIIVFEVQPNPRSLTVFGSKWALLSLHMTRWFRCSIWLMQEGEVSVCPN